MIQKTTSGRPAARKVAVVSAALVLFVSACSNAGDADAPNEVVVGASDRELVVVERGDLESVVVVSGTVSANPEFVMSVDVSGILILGSGVDGDLAPGKVLGQIGGQDLTVKHHSFIKEWLVQDGQFTAPNSPIALAKYAGYGVALSVPASQMYRIYETPTSARANIESGPGGVGCSLVPAKAAEDTGSESVNLPALCLLPMDAKLIEGLPAQVGLATGKVHGGLMIPVSSVLGSADRGRVSKLDKNGDSRIVEVELGVSDGVNIEVLSGLSEGDRVLGRAPKLYQ